ncbi:Tudor domain [Trinorchestia longiramus]|nr:Tudor domain [Trinorchestia longiramus]
MEPAGSTAEGELEQKRNTVLILIKSLLNSAQGDLTIEQLERDYLQMVNEAIPYRQLHHATLASLLQSAPETAQLVNRSGKLYVTTPPGARDHVAALVAGQRPASKKSNVSSTSSDVLVAVQKRASSLPMRRPVPRVFPRPALLPHPNIPPHPLPHMRPCPPLRLPPQRWSQPPASASQMVRSKKPKYRGKLQAPPRMPPPHLPPAYPNFRPHAPGNSFRPLGPAHTNFRPAASATNSMKPSLSKDRENIVKELKQRLEKLIEELGYPPAVFRSVPLQNRWLATLEVNKKRYSSFPDERPTIEEAEAIVAQKALDDLQHLSTAPSCPETSSLDLCISRVAQLVRGELHGLWFSHLCEVYKGRHSEILPADFCERACERETQFGDTGIAFIKHENLWILNEKKDPGGANGRRTSDGGSSSGEHRSLPYITEQQQHSMSQQPSSLPNLPLQQPPSHGLARRTNSSSRAHEHPPSTKSHRQKSNRERPSLLRASTMPVHPTSLCRPAATSSAQQRQERLPHLGPAPRKSGDRSYASSKADASKIREVQQKAVLNKLHSLSLKNSWVVTEDRESLPGGWGVRYKDVRLTEGAGSSVGIKDTNKLLDTAESKSGEATGTSSTTTSLDRADSMSCVDFSSDASSSGPVINGVKEDSVSDISSVKSAEPASLPPQPPQLRLPEEDTWQVYVSHVMDDCRICFRLIGDSYNSAYEELVTRMELHYFDEENCTAPPSVYLGHYYVLRHHETWFRVLVVGVTESSVSALFVDHGETEEVAREDVFELAQQFMNLPCQYVKASLSDLEGICCAPLTSALHTKVLGQTFSATVTSRSPAIKVVLYDTSGPERVNINEQLMQVVPESFIKPQLPQVGGIAEVFVTAVHDNGRVFVTVKSETYTLLERMLAMAKVRAEELSGETEVDLTKLYLARFSSDQDWHRVRAIAPSSKQHKAMECTLANVPPAGCKWTRRARARLEELQPPNSPVLLKTVKVNPMTSVPEVLLFKRLLPQNELISMNETLAIDSKLFSDSEENNNESQSSDGEISVGSPPPRGPTAAAPPPAPENGNKKTRLTTPQVPAPRLPAVGDELDVYVTFAANPDNFAVQPVKEYSHLEKLRREMQQHYSSSSSVIADSVAADELVVGGYYAALHTDTYWYRVEVNQVVSLTDMVCGVFIDFGDCFVSACSKMRKLLPVFSRLPHQSIKASLAGVLPRSGDWMPEDTCRFRDLVQDREFVSYVLGTALPQDLPYGHSSSASSSARLFLKLVDTSHETKDVYIDELLIEEGRARSAQPSKSNGSSLSSKRP